MDEEILVMRLMAECFSHTQSLNGHATIVLTMYDFIGTYNTLTYMLQSLNGLCLMFIAHSTLYVSARYPQQWHTQQ